MFSRVASFELMPRQRCAIDPRGVPQEDCTARNDEPEPEVGHKVLSPRQRIDVAIDLLGRRSCCRRRRRRRLLLLVFHLLLLRMLLLCFCSYS